MNKFKQLKDARRLESQDKRLYDTIVLGGHSTNAVTIIGALQRLYDTSVVQRDVLRRFVGTSSGAIIGALLAVGYTPIELLVYACVQKPYKKMSALNIANLVFLRKSMTTIEPIAECMRSLIIERHGYVPTMSQLYENLGMNLVCVTFDLSNEETCYLSHETHGSLDIVDAAIMSASFPFVFDPFVHKSTNNTYIDGGITDNFAVDYVLAKYQTENCIGVVITNTDVVPTNSDINISFQLLCKLLNIFIDGQTMQKISRAKSAGMTIINVKRRCDFFNFDTSVQTLLEMFDDGYIQASSN